MNIQMRAYIFMLHLVSQRWANFTDFRDLLGWDNFQPMNAGNILSHIHKKITELSEKWDESIPFINFFVFKENGSFTEADWVSEYFEGPTLKEIAQYAADVAAYKKWDKVLDAFREDAFDV